MERTSSQAVSAEYAVEGTSWSAWKYSTLPGPKAPVSGSTRKATGTPCLCRLRAETDNARWRPGKSASKATTWAPVRLV